MEGQHRPTEEQAAFTAAGAESKDQPAVGAYSEEFARLLEECGGDPRVAMSVLEMQENGFNVSKTS
ncbi:MAG: hypothetical protein NUV98_02755 [Candidatus Roizmanbacteria bacterium]|nr:hypothetical protein [Candidatus Roizmanbacteria bacterium]